MPVMMLTARDEEVDRIAGLEAGADDYMVKPFSIPELLTRVRAQLRRLAISEAASVPGAGPIVRGPLSIRARAENRMSPRVERVAGEFQRGFRPCAGSVLAPVPLR